MKKRLLLTAVLLTLICLLFTACQNICPHIYDANGVCKICGYEDIRLCTVNFDTDGGSEIPMQTVVPGSKLTKPNDPTKEGYVFDGWYCGDEGWSFIGYTVTEDMTLTAKWAPTTCDVKFLDEKGMLIAFTKATYGKKISPPSLPEKENCLLGWFCDNVLFDFENSTVKSDMTLKPKWIAYVTYELNGGTNNKNNPAVLLSDNKYPIQLHDPEKDGYMFWGWFLDADLTEKVTSITGCEHLTLYAAWIPEKTDDPNDEYKYLWNKTKLIFQMSENSNHQELPSTCGRYLAGNLDGVEDISTIDKWVADRNIAAMSETNVVIEYQYLPDTTMYGWSWNIDLIDSEVRSKEPGRPDMYCNFVYDMVAVSLKGSFANLLSTTMYEDGHQLAGLNYFDFVTNPNLSDVGAGYMLDYMRSLTLSKFKMYCLSSDYFTDMVRAFLVVPVNISLFETLQASGTYNAETGKGDFLADRATTYDRYGNVETSYTIEDLYQLVYDMEWNYETLAQFSEAIFSDGEDGDEAVDLRDTVGFALGTSSGLGAVGLLYSSSVTIIDKFYDVDKGDYTYSYPYMVQQGSGNNVSFVKGEGTHEELINFCDNLNTLFGSKGIIAVSPSDTFSYANTDLKAIRARFASGNVLFGGIVKLGSLEYDEYKEMNDQGKSGYGIVPVPLYRTNYVDATGEVKVDRYNTVIHNIGKIGAISYTTEKFAQCTAYLNYQSTHSTDILNEYYSIKHQYDVVGTGVKGNVEMLKYIRYNVRSNFDKTFEDALGSYYSVTDAEVIAQQWHTFIRYAKYQLTDMAGYYDSFAPQKAWRLYNLENSIYPTLPD